MNVMKAAVDAAYERGRREERAELKARLAKLEQEVDNLIQWQRMHMLNDAYMRR